MKTIYKYKINPFKDEHPLPSGAQILSVGEQNGQIHLWALVDTENKEEDYYFEVIGTGWEIEPPKGGQRKFIGTVFIGDYVWHVFQRVDLKY